MARIRTIKPEFFTSDDIVALSLAARLLYIGLWCEADREGRFEWKPKAFKRRYLPDDDCDIDGVCSELLAKGLVALYGENLAYIPTFSKHQHINGKETPSRLPSPIDGSVAESFTHFGWRKAIFDRDGNKCVRCGDTDGPHEIDHIVPRSSGGTDNAINLRVLCKGCNRARPVSGDALIEDLRRDGYDFSVLVNDTQYTRPEFRRRVVNASGRVVNASTDATSLPFPSLPSQGGLGETASVAEPAPVAAPAASPSTPVVRPQRRQGPGAGAGSYPRDHLAHGFCGSRFCVSAESFAGMVRRYGDGGDAAVTGFLQRLNDDLPAAQSPGGPVWVLKHFDRWLETSGRVAPVPPTDAADDDGDALWRRTQERDRQDRERAATLPPPAETARVFREALAEAQKGRPA